MTAFTGLILQAVAIAMVPMTDSVSMIALTQVIGELTSLTYPLLMALSIQSVPARDRATAMGVFQAIYVWDVRWPGLSWAAGRQLRVIERFYISTAACLAGAALHHLQGALEIVEWYNPQTESRHIWRYWF